MSENTDRNEVARLRSIAAATFVVLGILAGAGAAYLLLDVLLLLFIGIVIAAALQPWQTVLCRWGMPRGPAVLLIYLWLMVALALVVVVVAPVVTEQFGVFATEIPRGYANAREWLQASASAPLHLLGQRLPPLERLTPALSELAPQLYLGTLGVTTSIVKLPVYFVTVFVIAFYWTMEVPRFERLVLSLVAVERRAAALNVWHEIELRLGGFIRGQGLAMLFVGTASGLAYALIGIPNALVLGLLAGFFEAVPLIGAVLGVIPALLLALPLGMHTVTLVVAFAVGLHLVESDVLIPRIMHRAAGVSSLVSILALLAFGTLYGILGVLIAIPMAAVLQVLLDTLIVHSEEPAMPADALDAPSADLRMRVHALQQHARTRLRARTSRMGIDPDAADHVADAVDQQIELALARIERLVSTAEGTTLTAAAETAFVEKLQNATRRIEDAVERVDTVEPVDERAREDLEDAMERFRVTVSDVERDILTSQQGTPRAAA